MTIAELMPTVRNLPRSEKFQLAQLLLEDLSREESSPRFQERHTYPIYTPGYVPGAAAQLAQLLADEKTPS